MPDDLEKRVSLLERSQDAFNFQLDAITKGIAEIKESLNGINSLVGRVGTLEVRMEAAWRKIDSHTVDVEVLRRIKDEHDICRPKVESMCTGNALWEHRLKAVEDTLTKAGNIVQGRVNSFTDKLIWGAFIVIGCSAALFALKGFFQ